MQPPSPASNDRQRRLTEDQLIQLPFDQYQRYRDVREVVDRLREGSVHWRLLDVGGGEAEYLPALDFFPNDFVVVADLHALPFQNYIRFDGRRLPFADDAFDVVFSCDTFEHVPPGNRQNFLQEMFRVASRYVVLVAPFHSRLNELAEQFVQDVFTAECGKPNQALLEHVENGLPDTETAAEIFRRLAAGYISFPSGYVPNWLVMNSVSFVFGTISTDLYRAANRLYNQNFYPGDHRSPAYRTCFVAAKNRRDCQGLDVVRDYMAQRVRWQGDGPYTPGQGDQLNIAVPELSSWQQALGALKDVLRERDTHGGNLSRALEDRDARLRNLSQSVEDRDVNIRDLSKVIEERDTQIFSLGVEFETLKQELAQRDRVTQELQHWSNQIKSSNGWRILQRYYRLREAMLPVGSKRRGILQLCWRILTRQPVFVCKQSWKDL
jgi:hypothetical protein